MSCTYPPLSLISYLSILYIYLLSTRYAYLFALPLLFRHFLIHPCIPSALLFALFVCVCALFSKPSLRQSRVGGGMS